MDSCPALGNSTRQVARAFTQAVSQKFLAWYCSENGMPLQRLRYVQTGSLMGVRGVGGKPGMFCLHFCQPPGSFSGIDTNDIMW